RHPEVREAAGGGPGRVPGRPPRRPGAGPVRGEPGRPRAERAGGADLDGGHDRRGLRRAGRPDRHRDGGADRPPRRAGPRRPALRADERVGAGAPHPGAGPGLRPPRPPAGGLRSTAVPVLRPADRPRGPPLPPHELMLDRRARGDRAAQAALLREGTVEVVGRMPWSSTATCLCEVTRGDESMRAIYKPRRGERPLWDFPTGLDQREVAAYELAEALGWDLVPVTVRGEGPLGPGSLQAFVEADFEQHYFTLVEDEDHHDALRALCAFDLIGNNTDRKSGHVLLGLDGRIYGIDHGLMFHHEFKLRTVI